MAAWRAAAARGERGEIHGYFPVAEGAAGRSDQTGSGAGMGAMTGCAGPSLAGIGDVQHVEIPVSVAETSIADGPCGIQHGLIVAAKTEGIG